MAKFTCIVSPALTVNLLHLAMSSTDTFFFAGEVSALLPSYQRISQSFQEISCNIRREKFLKSQHMRYTQKGVTGSIR